MSEKIETGGPAFPRPQGGDAGMTLRQYAAIKLRVPNSGTDWLDEMIRQSLRDELAGKAMQGLLKVNRPTDIGGLRQEWADEAYLLADATLKAREVKHGQG